MNFIFLDYEQIYSIYKTVETIFAVEVFGGNNDLIFFRNGKQPFCSLK